MTIVHPQYKPTKNQPLDNGKNHEYAVPSSPEPEYRELEPEKENSAGPYYSQAQSNSQQPPPTRGTSIKANNAFNNNSQPNNDQMSRKPTLVIHNENSMKQTEDSGQYSVPEDPRYHKLNHNDNQIRFAPPPSSIKQIDPRPDQVPDPDTPDYNTRRNTSSPQAKSPYQNINRTTNRSMKGSNALTSVPNDELDGAEEEDYDTEYAAPTTQLLQTTNDNADNTNDTNKDVNNYRHYSSPDHEEDEEEDEESNYYSTPAQNEDENEALVPRPPSGMYAKVKK